uniref:(northern house mosquito) hypothetical protein n=2 Tax=Culex pipiens TaxID=7175 RepID=A0A8D8F676_CULPI
MSTIGLTMVCLAGCCLPLRLFGDGVVISSTSSVSWSLLMDTGRESGCSAVAGLGSSLLELTVDSSSLGGSSSTGSFARLALMAANSEFSNLCGSVATADRTDSCESSFVVVGDSELSFASCCC